MIFGGTGINPAFLRDLTRAVSAGCFFDEHNRMVPDGADRRDINGAALGSRE